jgi:chromate transport protein ChrA
MLEGFNNVLEILANKVSRKSSIIALAMVLLFLLATAETVASVLLVALLITGLAVFLTFIQWILDLRDVPKKTKKQADEDKKKVLDK